MRRFSATMAVLVAVIAVECVSSRAISAAETPADRVVVMYFHRTDPCPTCRKMSAYTEEAVTKAFAKEMKRGKVEYHYIDFQDEKNEKLVKGYQVERPTLIVVKVAGNKAKDHKNLLDMWSKVGDKKEFIEYVQDNVKNYLK
jgi:thiol-disulfide isomerase/thioredoxin